MARPRLDAKTRDEDAASTSWGFGFLASESEAQIQSRHSFYMFEFRVRKCPLFRTHSCKHCKPFSCRYAHYENQTRRVPKLVGETWSYDVQLCTANSLLECPQGLKCAFSHRLQKENIYHPMVYKTKVCEHSLVSCGPPQSPSIYTNTQAVDFFPPASQEWFQCSEFGIHCAKAHGSRDLRIVPGSEDAASPENVPSASPLTVASSSSPSLVPSSALPTLTSSQTETPNTAGISRAPSASSLRRVASTSSLARVGSSSSLARVSSSSSLARVSSTSALVSPTLSNRRVNALVLRPSSRENSTHEEEPGGRRGSRCEGEKNDEDQVKQGEDHSEIKMRFTSNNNYEDLPMHNSHSNTNVNHSNKFLLSFPKENRNHTQEQASNAIATSFSSSSSSAVSRSLPSNSAPASSNNNSMSRSLPAPSSSSSSYASKGRLSSPSLVILDAPAHLEAQIHSLSLENRNRSASFYTPPSGLIPGTELPSHAPELNLSNSISHSSSCSSLSSQGLRRVESNHSLRRVDSGPELDSTAGQCNGWLNAHGGQEPQSESIAHSHQIYLDSFRVRMCVDFLSNKCNFNSRTCFHAHHQRNRRRRPLLVNGRFNYISTRCPTLERERTCPSGASCHYAHTAEEVVYHPSKYKTHMCAYALGRDNACSEYGMHCAKAHGPEDKRDPVLGDDEMSRNDEHAHFLFEYKTKPCEGYTWDCNGRQYHSVKERRRLLVNIRYLPDPCPNVFVGQKWGAPNIHCRDESGNRMDPEPCGEGEEWRCFLAHTPNEINYHPLVYKTVACEAFDRNQPCEGRFCPHSHGASDRRTQHAAREWKTQIVSRAAQEASNQRLSRTGSYALLPRSGGPSLPRNASYPSLKTTATAPAPSFHADPSYSTSPSPSFASPRRGALGTRFVDEDVGSRKRSDSATVRPPSQDVTPDSRTYAESGLSVQPRAPNNPYPATDHETTPGCFAPFSFGLGLSFENSLWARQRGEDIWRPPDKTPPEPFTVRPALDCETGAGGPWCSCATFQAKLACKHVAPVLSIPSPQSSSQSSSDSPRSPPSFHFSSISMPILSSCAHPRPLSPSRSSSFSPQLFSPPPVTSPQSIPVVEPNNVHCSCARFFQTGTCKHISRGPLNNSPPKSSLVDTATAAAVQLGWRAEELMDQSHRKLSGYMGSLGDRIEADREWFRKSKSSNGERVAPRPPLSNESSQSSEGDLFNTPPPAYTPSSDQVPVTLTGNTFSSKDLKKTSELIAEAKMKGMGVVPPRSSSSSPNVDSPTASSASLLRKSLSKVSSLRLPDVKALFPAWPPPRTSTTLTTTNSSHSTVAPPPAFFDSNEPVVEEELEPLGKGSDPPSPSMPQPQRVAWASTPLDFSDERVVSLHPQASSDQQSASELPISSFTIIAAATVPSTITSTLTTTAARSNTTVNTFTPSAIISTATTFAASLDSTAINTTPATINNSATIAETTTSITDTPATITPALVTTTEIVTATPTTLTAMTTAAPTPTVPTTTTTTTAATAPASLALDPLSLGLSCKFPVLFPQLARPHILVNPVSLQCCGLCMCRTCVASAVAAAEHSLLCTCGTPITATVLEGALVAPSNQALMAILSLFNVQQQFQ